MKKITKMQLIAVSIMIGFTGCGEVDDKTSSNSQYEDDKKAGKSTQLAARSIKPYDEREHTYYGECRYSDSSMPILIQNDNPFIGKDEIMSSVPIYFLRKDETTADVIYGADFDKLEATDEVTLFKYNWSLELSDDKTFYQGYRYLGNMDGNPFHCQVFASLNAKTKDDLQTAIDAHKNK